MGRKNFRRFVAIMLVVLLCLTSLPAAAFATDAEEGNAWDAEKEQTEATEDASVQLGEYTQPSEPEETAAPQAETEAEETEPAPIAEPEQAPAEAQTEPNAQEPEEAEEPRANENPIENKGIPTRAVPPLDGRDYAGQIVLSGTRIKDGERESVDYILIGSPQQLEALDEYPALASYNGGASADEMTEAARYNVTGPIWRVKETRATAISLTWTPTNEAELVYPGDADLVGDYADYPLYAVNNEIVVPAGITGRHGNGYSLGDHEDGQNTLERYTYYGDTNGQPDTSKTSYSYGNYSPRSDYVVFRNIDLEGYDWAPLMFYGTMLGARGKDLESGTSLQDAVDAINMSARSSDYADDVPQPIISNVTIHQTAKLNINKYTGVGFFATISSARPGVSEFASTNIQAQVRNLMLTDVSVTNESAGIETTDSLVSALTGFLGGTVGKLLDVLLEVLLGKDTGFTDALNSLLDARRKDPTNQATGSFVGKVDGDVLIENCDVVRLTVSSDYSYVGGFVGYSSGIVEYDALSGIAGGLLTILTNLLNIIPGIGLGDLITVVKQVLPLNNIIPIGYLNPRIVDCGIYNLSGTLGVMTQTVESDTISGVMVEKPGEYAGGFIGCKIATVMINCSINDSTYAVQAQNYAGGFAGMARDAVIQELLTDLGLDLGLMKAITERLSDANVNLQSLQVRCNINNCSITVTGDSYLGGFNGAMTNAYCINNELNCPGNSLTVTGTGDCVGGFAGLATLGYSMSLGSGTVNESLLTTLNKVLTTLLSNYGDSLLNLMGVGQSEILGLQFDFGQENESGAEVSVTGRDYVGGLVGKGDAVIMGGASEENLLRITYVKDGDLSMKDIFPNTDTGSGFAVTYLTPSGVSAPTGQTGVAFGDPVTLPANPGSEPTGYSFAGWTVTDYHDSDVEPARIYQPGDSYVVTRDVVFRALYEKPGEYVYVLMTEQPDSLPGDYVITYGTLNDLMLLTGLADDASYQTANSGGATALADTAAEPEDRVVLNNGRLSNVSNKYVFTVEDATGSNMYSIKNKDKNTYLRVNLIGDGVLTAESTYLAGSCKWGMVYSQTALNTTIKSDTVGAKGYIGYNTAGYFQIAPASQTEDTATLKIKDIYLWKKTLDGPYYDTFTVGSGAAISVASGSVYDSVNVRGMKNVTGRKFVGGVFGLADTASVASLVGTTAGLASFEKFEISDVHVNRNGEGLSVSTGLSVTASAYYAGGGGGMAMGGSIERVSIDEMKSAEGLNCVGGFAGCVGPGQLAGTGGLDVKLLGLDLISANNLLSVADGMETTMDDVTVTGWKDGYTVEATGENEDGEQTVYCAGGFFGRSNSTSANDCHAVKVQWVKANEDDGRAGGFLGVSEVGGLASMDDAEGTAISGLIAADNLLGAVGYLIPEYSLVDVRFVNSGYVEAAWAGGFAADFESGVVDNSGKAANDRFAVYNVDRVTGTLYAGGFGGKVYSGALADAGGGISILGNLEVSISASDLLCLVGAYVPKIICAGVKSDLSTKYPASRGEADTHNGFIVEVTDANEDKTTGAAGGFIGYGSGVQVSYSDVTLLRHTVVEAPDELEGVEADSYFDGSSEYAVTGTRYAGGYMGFMDVGSAASLGGGLKVLGSGITLNNVLGALDVVISTVEHSDVYGAPGGFAVLATWESAGDGSEDTAESLTVCVVDESNSAYFNAYLWNDGTGEEALSWPGLNLGAPGTEKTRDKNHKNYYSFTVNTGEYDRLIFNTKQNQNDSGGGQSNTLDLSNLNGSLIVYMNDTYYATTDGYDIWNEDYTVQQGCQGEYTRNVGVRGTYFDYTANPDTSHEHNFGVWTPYPGVNLHYHECVDCGFRENETDQISVNCSFDDGYCTVCGRRDVNLPASIQEKAGFVGRAGGFVGWLRGSHIQDSSSYNFSYIIAEIAAGGYVGEMEPGSVADALGPTDVLGGLVNTSGSLLSLAKDFVPSIRNSVTTCIPCGGAVRAQSPSDEETQRGMAGGYAGHNCGGQIWGNNEAAWKDENEVTNEGQVYVGEKQPCEAIRILSVYGYEYAGGFTGLMESANTADTGSLSLLWGLVDANNVLGALSVVYPTEENTAVYGPLAGLTRTEWNAWVEYVGKYGGYGLSMETYDNDEDFEEALPNYRYGFHAAAGRDEYSTEAIECKGGYAGGYVGAMRSGTVTNGQAYDVKQVRAMHAAGGFAGEMAAGGAADLGSVSLLGLGLDLSNLISALNVFTPCVKTSSVHGYQSGMTVAALGDSQTRENNELYRCGDAGGYVGAALGAQIWGDETENVANPNDGCGVYNLKKVQGVHHVGGYAGDIRSGSAADVNTNTDDGLFQDILNTVIATPASTLTLLNATLSTVRNAAITVADPLWGFTVEGIGEEIPVCAGGFAGYVNGAVIGDHDGTTMVQVNDLRGVKACEYAGGFVGLADVGGAATVAGKSGTDVLGLLSAGQVSLLDAFRPYIYYAEVTGVNEGFTVQVETSEEEQQGLMASVVYTGCSGGFGGAVLDGTVENSTVSQLSTVTGPNYVGGFIGYCGKSGVADVDSANVLGRLVGLQAGVGDSFGTTLTACEVEGVTLTLTGESLERGYTVTANGDAQPTAGGFIGYGDLAQIDDCHAELLKYVESKQIAGGFIGRTSLGYLVEAQVGGTLLNAIVYVVNSLLDVLSVGDLENLGVISLNLSPVLNLNVLTDGDLLYVDLLGLKIGVALNDENDNAARVVIGDSYIELPVDNEGHISADDMPSNLTVRLIRVNHTRTEDCSVTGVDDGYDVFGGGASQDEDGTDPKGHAGGFVGLNDEGRFEGCEAANCDVVRGTEGLVGPFNGTTKHDSVYENQNIVAMEGTDNSYNGIYHDPQARNDAVYETDAKVVLMDDAALLPNPQSLVVETADMQNPCLNEVELTLSKVWDDMDGALGQRKDANEQNPVTVTFTVKRVTKTAAGAVVANSETTVRTVTLTEADANAFTKNVWTKKLSGLPATVTDAVSGETAYYSYFVTEASLSGYVSGTAYADADVTDKLSYSPDRDGGYAVSITNQAPLDQTIVVDFGLPVKVSVVEYLKEKYEFNASGLELAGILPVSDLENVSRYGTTFLGEEMAASEMDVNPDALGNPQAAVPAEINRTFRYGTFSVPSPEGNEAVTKLRYVPGSMQFDKPVEIAAALRSAEGVYYYTKVKVVPATTIYFEDDFVWFSEEWEDAGSGTAGEQGEDRPGADVFDLNNVYGYDSQYGMETTYSLERAKKVTVTKGMYPKASFTFTGTGFDLLSVTDRSTGFLAVDVYSGDSATGTPIASWAVDTFYGCTRSDNGYIRYLCVWDNNEEVWRVAKTAYPEMTDEEAAALVGTTEDGATVLADYPSDASTNHASFVVYKKDYAWTPDTATDTLYQIPIITSRGSAKLPGYGTYTVLLSPFYTSVFDHDLSDASYTLYVDGVRIYGPAEGLDTEYYLQDHEGWPQFIEMRNLLLGQNSYGQTGDEGNLVYIDGGIIASDIADFAQYGPNNEIYLDPGQAIAFTLKKGADAQVDQVHVSMTRVIRGSAEATFTSGTEEEPRSAVIPLDTTAECYYDLSGVIRWTDNETGLIVIANTGSSGTVSLRTMKVTYLAPVENASSLVTVKTAEQGQAAEALKLLRKAETLPIALDDDPVFLGATISLESDFSLHFYVPEEALEGMSNPYVVFTKDGEKDVCEYDYTVETVGETLCRRYTFQNVAASEMGTTVTARLFYNDNGTDHMSHALPYSVKQYAMNMLAKTEDEALVTLLVDMLNYGAEAQAYFHVNEEKPVNADLSPEQKASATDAVPAMSNQKKLVGMGKASVWFEGCSLSLEKNVTINYYLDLSTSGKSREDLVLEVTWNSGNGEQKSAVIDGSAFEARQANGKTLYVAVFDELNAAQMRTVVTAVVRDKADGRIVSDAMEYSIESYAGSKAKSDETLAELLIAMMKFGDAARAYFINH